MCAVCGCTFENIRQLGPHVRTCKANVVAQSSAVATTTSVSTAVPAAVVTVPVLNQPSTMHTPMSELARREKHGGSWRRQNVHIVRLIRMPPGELARDYREVHARNHITHQQTHEQQSHSSMLALDSNIHTLKSGTEIVVRINHQGL